MMRTVTTTDDTLHVYQHRELASIVIAKLPEGIDIQLGDASVHEGREWVEAILEGGKLGYVLAASARGHTRRMDEGLGYGAVAQTGRGFLSSKGSVAPFSITVTAPSRTTQDCEGTVPATLHRLGADILAGGIPRSAPVSTKSADSEGKHVRWSGTLE